VVGVVGGFAHEPPLTPTTHDKRAMKDPETALTTEEPDWAEPLNNELARLRMQAHGAKGEWKTRSYAVGR
jgi:hypothetical protein